MVFLALVFFGAQMEAAVRDEGLLEGTAGRSRGVDACKVMPGRPWSVTHATDVDMFLRGVGEAFVGKMNEGFWRAARLWAGRDVEDIGVVPAAIAPMARASRIGYAAAKILFERERDNGDYALESLNKSLGGLLSDDGRGYGYIIRNADFRKDISYRMGFSEGRELLRLATEEISSQCVHETPSSESETSSSSQSSRSESPVFFDAQALEGLPTAILGSIAQGANALESQVSSVLGGLANLGGMNNDRAVKEGIHSIEHGLSSILGRFVGDVRDVSDDIQGAMKTGVDAVEFIVDEIEKTASAFPEGLEGLQKELFPQKGDNDDRGTVFDELARLRQEHMGLVQAHTTVVKHFSDQVAKQIEEQKKINAMPGGAEKMLAYKAQLRQSEFLQKQKDDEEARIAAQRAALELKIKEYGAADEYLKLTYRILQNFAPEAVRITGGVSISGEAKVTAFVQSCAYRLPAENRNLICQGTLIGLRSEDALIKEISTYGRGEDMVAFVLAHILHDEVKRGRLPEDNIDFAIEAIKGVLRNKSCEHLSPSTDPEISEIFLVGREFDVALGKVIENIDLGTKFVGELKFSDDLLEKTGLKEIGVQLADALQPSATKREYGKFAGDFAKVCESSDLQSSNPLAEELLRRLHGLELNSQLPQTDTRSSEDSVVVTPDEGEGIAVSGAEVPSESRGCGEESTEAARMDTLLCAAVTSQMDPNQTATLLGDVDSFLRKAELLTQKKRPMTATQPLQKDATVLNAATGASETVQVDPDVATPSVVSALPKRESDVVGDKYAVLKEVCKSEEASVREIADMVQALTPTNNAARVFAERMQKAAEEIYVASRANDASQVQAYRNSFVVNATLYDVVTQRGVVLKKRQAEAMNGPKLVAAMNILALQKYFKEEKGTEWLQSFKKKVRGSATL